MSHRWATKLMNKSRQEQVPQSKRAQADFPNHEQGVDRKLTNSPKKWYACKSGDRIAHHA